MNGEDARKKWCPMVRFGTVQPHQEITNRATDFTYQNVKCMADDCAVWVDDGDYKGHCGLCRYGRSRINQDPWPVLFDSPGV